MTTKIKSGVIAAGAIDATALADNSITIGHLDCSDGTNGQVLTTDGSGTLSFADGGVDGIVSSADATAITIDSSEKVGIGTTSPSDRLHVVGKARIQRATNANLNLISDNNTGANPYVVGTNSDTFFIQNQASSGFGTGGNFIQYNEGGSLQLMGVNYIDSSGNVGIGTDSPAEILHVSDTSTAGAVGLRAENSEGHVNFTTNGGGFQFETGASGAVSVIDSSGNMGIGTTSPDMQLEVAGASATAGTFKLSGRPDWTSGGGQVHIGSIYGENLGAGVNTTRIKLDGDDTSGSMRFYTANSGTLTSAMYIDSNQDITMSGTISSGAITSSGASTFSSNVNIDGELRLDSRGDGGDGDNVLAFKDSDGNYSIRHNVNDNNGNYSISLGYSGIGSGQYEVTGDGVGKLLFGGHGIDGSISLNAATTGTAGNNISFSMGLLVDHNAVRVGASANGTGLQDGEGTKVFDSSGNAFATSYSTATQEVITSGNNLTNIAKILGNSSSGGTTTFDVGRGDVYFESNGNSNANGAGITLRTSDNPTSGSIFEVRSSGQACRFFSGQSITTAGINPFYVGAPTTGGEYVASNYAIKLGDNGNIICEGTLTENGTVSDIRKKEHIEPIDNAVERLQKIKGITFSYKNKPEENRLMGVIAQDLLKDDILKLAVYDHEDFKLQDDDPLKNTYAVRYNHLTAILIEAVKEQQQQIDELKAENDALRARIEVLEG
jgi:hypothetical protein